jgi:hypothetical protein
MNLPALQGREINSIKIKGFNKWLYSNIKYGVCNGIAARRQVYPAEQGVTV